MREILFRGKRIDNGEWTEGYYAIIGERKVIIALPEMYYDDNGKECYGNEIKDVDPETVCQYIGLKDKNSIEIFEGDIVRITTDDEELCEIEWDENTAQYALTQFGSLMYDFGTCWPTDTEVIGNIFDNPELLDEGH